MSNSDGRSKRFQELLNAYTEHDQSTLSRIYEIGRIEALHSARKDILLWAAGLGVFLTILGIFGINEVIKNSVTTEVGSAIHRAEEDLEELRVGILSKEEELTSEIQKIQSLTAEFQQQKEDVEKTYADVVQLKRELEQTRESIAAALEGEQNLRLLLQRTVSETFTIQSISCTLTVILGEDYDTAFRNSFANVQSEGFPLTAMSELMRKPLINIQTAIGKWTETKGDENFEWLPVAYLGTSSFSIAGNVITMDLELGPQERRYIINEPIEDLDGVTDIDLVARPELLGNLFRNVEKMRATGMSMPFGKFDEIKEAVRDFYSKIDSIEADVYVNGVAILGLLFEGPKWEMRADEGGEFLVATYDVSEHFKDVSERYKKLMMPSGRPFIEPDGHGEGPSGGEASEATPKEAR